MSETDTDTAGADLHEPVARLETGREWTGVPLTEERPKPGVGLLVTLEIPREVARPYEVAAGRYLIPASVVRPYPATIATQQ
jgi:hypothetical protein